MSRYFFEFADDLKVSPDPQGVWFDDREAARAQAIGTLVILAHEALPDGQKRVFSVEMMDESRRPVFRAQLAFDSEWITDAR